MNHFLLSQLFQLTILFSKQHCGFHLVLPYGVLTLHHPVRVGSSLLFYARNRQVSGIPLDFRLPAFEDLVNIWNTNRIEQQTCCG
jgi:hypothetical protein